ncbi:phage holin family protein [Paracoccus sp. S-4012]|uniref:phage holin family protein n=1 Tax=Paracoccus sp. S-4012 TaxID=2665648 RepID=UPI0012B0FFF2|nr:phage holin family protein [Paracoccus sp. S-4012]MRX51252.1 phage holin family protein [Paracoccus sp. S-4012]
MFDYARKMQLAVSDMGRRAGLKAGAGVLGLIAAGFLLAALWTLLARTFGWGPLWASLAIGVLFLVVAGILWGMSSNVKHPVPSTDELKREVEARATMAAEVAMDKAQVKAREVVDMAENKAMSLIDQARYKAEAFVNDTEAKVQRFTRQTVDNTARKVGLTPDLVDDAKDLAERAKSSRAMPAATVIGAFAVGLTLASRLGARLREQSEWDEVWDEDDDEADDHGYWDDPHRRV